jgi:hypothetical protein
MPPLMIVVKAKSHAGFPSDRQQEA